MKKVIVDADFWEVFPEATIEILSVSGIDNHVTEENEEMYHQLLNSAAKRANQEREFFPINPLVDIYNSISLSFGVPCGGEDIEKISGNLHLGKAQGGESFLPLGADSDAPALPEEIIYYDEQGAICRCLNWREAQRTMLTEETQAAVLVIESINAEQAARGAQAIEALKEKIDQTFGVSSVRHTLTKDESEAEL